MSDEQKQQQDPQQVLRAFLESIIDAAHEELEPELREQMLADLGDRLNDRLILTVLANLTEQEQEEFEKLASDAGRVGEIEGWLRGRIPHYDELMAQTMEQFRADYVAGANEEDPGA